MFVIDKLTVGQTTFILRVAVQIISYGGLFLIGLLILGSTPRVASVKTHSLLNRIVGKSTVTKASMKWVWDCIRGRNSRPGRHTRLLTAIALLTLYELFITLSDIGFLGFYSCSVPGPSFHDYPASISTDQLARSTILANLINGTNPNAIPATRCDSIVAVDLGPAGTGWTCDALHIFTWANASFFAGLNTTDSDTLMPRQLGQFNNQVSSFVGPGSSRVESPTVSGGIAINLHATGFQAVFGVPQLGPQRQVILKKAMALEFEMGCMTLGISSTQNLNSAEPQLTIFQTNGTWQQYAGPDYLRDVLSEAADALRQYLIPAFNKSSLASDGSMAALNDTEGQVLSNVPHVGYLPIMDVGGLDSATAVTNIFGNCTNALIRQLNLTVMDSGQVASPCGTYEVGGTVSLNGQQFETQIQMVCASASQVNMVSATIQTDAQNAVSVELTRLPSDLNYLHSSNFYNVTLVSNETATFETVPIERYTLSDNPDGLTSHFIVPYGLYFSPGQQIGAGSGGTSFAWLGTFIASSTNLFDDGDSLLFLDPEPSNQTLNVTTMTEWGGQAGASFILASTTYNSWAALDSAPIVVFSTGGKVATCYHLQYAIGFLPLILSTLFVVGWSAFMAFTSGFKGLTHLEQLYEGINPYRSAMFPNLAPKETSLIWEKNPNPHLEVIPPEDHLEMNYGQGSAQGYLQASDAAVRS